MTSPFQGGCLCGAVRYESSSEPLAVMDCHCRSCQHASGGASATAVVVPKDAFRVLQGTPKKFTSTGDTGKPVHRYFCEACGAPLFSEPEIAPIIGIRAGSLDDPSWLTLTGALYVSEAQPWAHIDRDKPVFEKMLLR